MKNILSNFEHGGIFWLLICVHDLFVGFVKDFVGLNGILFAKASHVSASGSMF